MTGIALILVFVVAIILMIVMISRWRIHPFVSIMLVALAFGLIAGIPLVDTPAADGTTTAGIATVIGQGFAGTFTSIGIVIILGALIGSILECTGAALRLADLVIKLVGKRRPVLAMQLMGWVVSIPVFCDSGFVILNPIRQALVARTRASSVAMTFGLASGLFISHVFIPPTPGPIAAANTLGMGDNLLLIIGMGVLCSIFPLIAGLCYARYIGKRVQAGDEGGIAADDPIGAEAIATIRTDALPGAWRSVAPIALPIVLMALASCVSMAKMTGTAADVMRFLGTPIIALAVGVLSAVITLWRAGKLSEFYDLTNETLKTVGPILFITAAGGVLGKVVACSDMVNYIEQHATVLKTLGIFFPFLLAAILKTAQGSSTVALVTTAGIVAPLLPMLGLDTPTLTALCVMAIGAGAMMVSHANDSYYWVVTNFGHLTPQQGYRVQTVGTGIIALAAILQIFLLSLIL